MGLCRQFHKLPSEVKGESAELLHLLHIEELGGSRDQDTAE